MNALDLARSRHTCKAYDSSRVIDDDTFATLMETLRLSPSSINIQPWQFLIAKSQPTKSKISHAMTGGDAHNVPKVMNASHVLIFCTRTHIDDTHLQKVLNAEQTAGRFRDENARINRQTLCQNYLQDYAKTPALFEKWADEQVFIALGHLLLTAQMMGINATPIGGFDKAVIDEAFELDKRGLRSTVIVSLGYASEEDFNQHLPKARLSYEEVFVHLD